jgi:hypothetical protein
MVLNVALNVLQKMKKMQNFSIKISVNTFLLKYEFWIWIYAGYLREYVI